MRGSGPQILPFSLRRRPKVRAAQGGYVADLEAEFEGVEVIARRKWIILPNHPFRVTWDWFLIGAPP
jgi:hypothetical protein